MMDVMSVELSMEWVAGETGYWEKTCLSAVE
jgi:hypothetical protein